jgi:hypothetical protein
VVAFGRLQADLLGEPLLVIADAASGGIVPPG